MPARLGATVRLYIGDRQNVERTEILAILCVDIAGAAARGKVQEIQMRNGVGFAGSRHELKRPKRPGIQKDFDGLHCHAVNYNSTPRWTKTSLSKADFG